MRRLNRITGSLLLVAASGSLALVVSAFIAHVPVREGSHDLVRIASGSYAEVPVVPQTYFEKYGVSELLLLGVGLVLVIVVAVVLRLRAAHAETGAGAMAWGTSVTCVALGIVGFVTIAPYLLLVGLLLVLACRTLSRNGSAAEDSKPDSLSVTTTPTH
jgi:hypothetical protein